MQHNGQAANEGEGKEALCKTVEIQSLEVGLEKKGKSGGSSRSR